ncbi:MAG: transcription elongation factor GreA [Deltaproteobacteria bacterium]|nr:transcription elongation factor GreA [Candidatus Anaeroferrophillacea bacterium]
MCADSAKVPMTAEGFQQLKEELKRLKTVERPAVIQAIAEARAHGDLSENAEYEAAKEKQSFIEGRISAIDDRLSRANVILPADIADSDRVVFGMTVTLEEEESGAEVVYRIVGEDEADIKAGKLSVNSPVARALIGRRLDDEVRVRTPGGLKQYLVVDFGVR